MLPTHRRPTTPGEILREEFLKPSRLTQQKLAERLGMSLQRLNGILQGRRAVTADTALLLAREFKTSPQLWMNLQTNVDLWDAQQRLSGARQVTWRAARDSRPR
ncbi:MAG: HigA family addiction module antidote protein [Deltaproteobacteria bacterium]|nr:HigA family addiction module antidote protein [Deltaproteobacteria bacterium]